MAQQSEYQHDAFISYNHVDQAWVQNELLPRLEATGLKVIIDYRDFEVGVPSLINMERAVETSRHTLIVLTPAWIESEWTEFESLLVATADPAARRRKLIPLLLKPCELPPRIGILTYANLTSEANKEVEFAKVIKALTGKDFAPPPKPSTQEKPMSGIPSTQYKELREALFDCGPFGDDAQLRAVFAHEKLRPFRYSVPQASDPAARVDATIAFLLEKYRADTRENALILLLRILRDRLDPADACHARLARLAENLEPVLMTSSPDSPLPSPPLQLIDKIRTWISNNQLEEALRELSGIAKYQNQAVMLERQLNRAHADERIGIITRSEAEATYGRIAAAILDIVVA